MDLQNSDILLWEETKRLVDRKWGRSCIFYKCLSITESKLLVDGFPKNIDRCHIFSRSEYPELKYNPNNIIPLKRFLHQRMDNNQNPLTGEYLEDDNIHWFWWYRIHQKKVIKYNPEINYRDELKKILRFFKTF